MVESKEKMRAVAVCVGNLGHPRREMGIEKG
jgi:hypothetical protein